jgi:hypothetical protein
MVLWLCAVVEVARSSFYAWLAAADGRATRQAADQVRAERIRVVHDEDNTYGAPRMLFRRQQGRNSDLTIVPIVKSFQARHGITDMVIVADAGRLASGNLRELDEAGLRFIVGSRVTKAPNDLASHFHWHGELFTDGQIIDTITPRDQRGTTAKSSDPKLRAEPVSDRT